MRWPWLYIFLAIFTFSTSSKAAHLVGGEISYKCVGNHNYEITLIIYRDCFSQGAGFDPSAAITIFTQGGVLHSNHNVPFQNNIQQLPNIAPNNCTTLPQSVCTEKGSYTFTAHLPPVAGGYTITHQRCCRNNTISNITNFSSQWGSTFTTSIPSMDSGCNTSPRFKDDPPVVLCVNVNVKLDLSIQEPDGDSIYYELCDALHGGANFGAQIAPDTASPPPYQNVPFNPGFSSSFPISSNPPFTINHQTGQLMGTPTQVGQFVFAICASEYRNGVHLSTTRRDFQFNVSADCQSINSQIRLDSATVVAYSSPQLALASSPFTICTGGSLDISNATVNASSYFWDFGDTTTLSDTSRLGTPNYSYQDTGKYVVMLVTEPHTPCADTSYALVARYHPVNTSFTYNGQLCYDGHSISFSNTSNISPTSTFEWDFGGSTNIGRMSTDFEPPPIVWDSIGAYYVRLRVFDYGCVGEYGDTLFIYPNPIAGEIIDKVERCLPYEVQFLDSSLIYGHAQHFWDFGDGHTSNDVDPIHTYTTPGTFTVTHAIKSLVGCLDSSFSMKKDIIKVLPVPKAGIHIFPKEQSVYTPHFEIIDQSEFATSTTTFLPNDSVIFNIGALNYSASDTGTYIITHVAFNEFGCTDTIRDSIHLFSPFNLYMPNAFTPNGDNINDIYRYTVTGADNSHIEIYNRWGEVVFKSNNPYEGWNGRKLNRGPAVESGLYTYVIIVNVTKGAYTYQKRGVIKLLR